MRTWSGVAVLALAAGLLSGDASSDTIASGESESFAVVSTGLVTFRRGKAVRLNVVEVDDSRTERVVRLSIFDGQKRLLSQTTQVLTPTRPVVLDLAKRDVPPPPGGDDSVLMRAVFEFPCGGEGDPGPIPS